MGGGFGAGAGTGELCGAVTGAVMVLDLLTPADPADVVGSKKRSVGQAKELQKRFAERFDALRCADLLQKKFVPDDTTPAAKALGLTGHCDIMIATAVEIVEQMIEEGMVASACAVGYGGIAEALFKMGLGNRIGFKMRADMPTHRMFEPMYGSIVLEMVSDSPAGELLGETTKEYTFESCGETLDLSLIHISEPTRPY